MLAGSSTLAMTPETGVPGAPAKPNDDLSIYAAGLGPVACVVLPGLPASKDHPCPLDSKMEVFIGDIEAAVSFAGLAPGTTGLYQVNVQVPAHVAPGNSVPVRFVVHTPDGGTVTSNVVTFAVTALPVN